MFEKASRLKLRFDTPKGSLTVEDLWDLPLSNGRSANLNDIAKGLNRDLKAATEEDFVTKASKADELLRLKFEIVKHVIDVRLAENEAAKTAAERKEKKARLLEILARKQDQQLEQASVEDLQKMLAEL